MVDSEMNWEEVDSDLHSEEVMGRLLSKFGLRSRNCPNSLYSTLRQQLTQSMLRSLDRNHPS